MAFTFQAEFEQPTGFLNPMSIRIPGRLRIEVYRIPGAWSARNADTRGQLKPIVSTQLEGAQQQVAEVFERQVSEWRRYKDGKLYGAEEEAQAGTATHAPPPSQNKPKAPRIKHLIDRANAEPIGGKYATVCRERRKAQNCTQLLAAVTCQECQRRMPKET